jgi:hypothetical protein
VFLLLVSLKGMSGSKDTSLTTVFSKLDALISLTILTDFGIILKKRAFITGVKNYTGNRQGCL